MVQRYLGKILLCIIISALFSYSPFDSFISESFKDNISNEWILLIKYLIVNIGVLVLSDLAITILSEKNDRVSHWKTQYDALSISYKDLKDRNKSLIHLFLGIIEKSEFKTSSKKSEVITEIHKLLENNFKEHIENTDLDIIVGRCQTIKELVSQTQVSRMFDNIDIMNKNTL